MTDVNNVWKSKYHCKQNLMLTGKQKALYWKVLRIRIRNQSMFGNVNFLTKLKKLFADLKLLYQ
jgi:hypothetical protein